MNLVEPLHDWADKTPDKLALIEGSDVDVRMLTFSELLVSVTQARLQLKAAGLASGSRALLMQPVGIDLYILLLACFSSGITAVLIDPAVSPEIMKYVCELSRPDAFIGTAKAHLLRLKFPVLRRINKAFHTNGWSPFSKRLYLENVEHAHCSLETLEGEHPALITFTSGSTGVPKATSRSHSFLIKQHHALAKSLNHHTDEVELITLPVFGLASLASGMTSVIADTDLKFPAKANSKAIQAQCLRHQVTRCTASPAFFKKLHQDQCFPTFQKIYTGGAPVFLSLLENLSEAFPLLDINTVYGSTEAEPISDQQFSIVSTPQKEAMKDGRGLLVGKPVSEILLKIVDITDEGATRELPTGEVGEIIVTGEHVLKGYLNPENDKETKLHIDNTIWHRTGDVGYLDPEQNLWLMGRHSAILQNEKGEVYPFCVEGVVMSIPQIEACALVKHQGEITLCYVGSPSVALLKSHTTAFGVTNYLQLDKIPLDARHNAKVDYPALMELLKS